MENSIQEILDYRFESYQAAIDKLGYETIYLEIWGQNNLDVAQEYAIPVVSEPKKSTLELKLRALQVGNKVIWLYVNQGEV